MIANNSEAIEVGIHNYRLTYLLSFEVTVGTAEASPFSSGYVTPKMLCEEIILNLFLT